MTREGNCPTLLFCCFCKDVPSCVAGVRHVTEPRPRGSDKLSGAGSAFGQRFLPVAARFSPDVWIRASDQAIMSGVRRFRTSIRRVFLRKKHFDSAFYLTRYPDVGASRMHPFAHYLLNGAAEGRKPNAWFDPDHYLARSPQARRRVDLNGRDPFVDFLEHGAKENASPH